MAILNSKQQAELDQLIGNKNDGFEYRKRRESDWLENYTLYRDRVTVNRLTQRQSVNLPIMKMQVKSLLKDVDDMPVIYFENLDNDKQKELFQNEYWKWTMDMNNADIQDIIDKKQVFMFGRSVDQMQIVDGRIKWTIQDPQDILISRYTDPADLHSSRFLVHTHIYRPLKELEKDPNYDQKAIAELKKWYSSEMGIVKLQENQEMAEKRLEKMRVMGVADIDQPSLGEAIVELSQHFVYDQKDGDKNEMLYMKTEADNQQIILNKRLEEVIGKTEDNYWQTHFPYESWADDVERQDFWSDGVADSVRTANKIANSYWSQLVENRTLRNYGMTFYDSTNESFTPSTFQPQPFGFYPVPGKPQDVLQRVEIPDLSESLDELTFLITMTEKASGATATQQGTQTERQVTLGEVQLALGEAKERIKGMSKFYTAAWKRRGTMFLKMIEAAPEKLDSVKIYRKGRNTNNIFTREIGPADWMTKSGYHTKVWSQDEKNTADSDTLQKLNATVTLIPGNQKLMDIYQRKLLEFAKLTPDEINEVLQSEQERRQAEAAAAQATQGMMGANPVMGQGQIAPAPTPAPMPEVPVTPVKPSGKNGAKFKISKIKSKLKGMANG